MKKILSLLMTLILMLVPFAAFAQTADDIEVYITPEETYGFAYPSDWVVISREIIEQAMEEGYTAGDGGIGDLFAALKPQMDQMDLVMVMNLSTSDNLNLVCQDVGSHLTDEQLLKNMEDFQKIWAQLDPDVEFVSEPEMMELVEGGYAYAVLMYKSTDVDGLPINVVQAITCEGTTQYTFTMTMYSTDGDAAMEAIDAMDIVLSTFTVM